MLALLLISVSALHHIIFASQANCTLQYIQTQLQKALTTWKLLWDNTMINSPTPVENISEIQYQKFGTQFYWLAQALLDSGSTDPESVTADTLAEIHALLQRI